MTEKVPEPGWLSGWAANPIGTVDAFSRFDSLRGLDQDELVGRWRGRSLPTGHPLDGLLELLGWYGKGFERSGRAHPLLFRAASGAPVSLNPRLMPTAVALRWPGLARSRPVRAAFWIASPALRTDRPMAMLCMCNFRDQRGAAMVYDTKPITDHFREVDANRILGAMEMRGMDRPFFFLLERDPAVAEVAR